MTTTNGDSENVQTKTDADVIIAGFGPGGAVLASILGQQGLSVVVLERAAAPYDLPRMSTLDGEIARVLQHAADGHEALKESLPQATGSLYGCDGKLVKKINWDSRVCGHPFRLSLHQPNIEAAIHKKIKSYPSVQVHWGTTVTAIDDRGDHVVVTARPTREDHDQADVKKLSARYLVGMDGGSSTVRQLTGIDMQVYKVHKDRWLMTDYNIIDKKYEEPKTEIHMDVPRTYYWGPNGAGRCRIDMKLLPDDPAEVETHEHALAFLQEKTGIPPEAVKITRQKKYRFRSEIAKQFRKGNVFLGGDAAHLMTPGSAQGSCSAMRDAINLGWRLGAVLTGRAKPFLLDSYEQERIAHVKPVIQSSLMMWEFSTETDPDRAAARDAFMRATDDPSPQKPLPLPTGFLQRASDGSVAPLAGQLSPQGRVRIDGREGLLDDIVGFGFQLISLVPVSSLLSTTQKDLLRRLGVHIVVIGDGVEDTEGVYKEFLGQHGKVAYLSRPDLFVFGVADTPNDIATMVDALAVAFENPAYSEPPVQKEEEVFTLPGAAFQHRSVQVGSHTVHYAESAPSNPLGTIVSLPGSAGLEMSTAKDLLATRYRVVEINPPGWGDEKDVVSFTRQSKIGELLAEAIKKIVKDRFLLIGTSVGGTNALYAAAQIPESVIGVVLEGSMTPTRPQDVKPYTPGPIRVHPKKPWATPPYVGHQMGNRMRLLSGLYPDNEAKPAIATLQEHKTPILALLGTDDEIIGLSQEEVVRAVMPQADFQLIEGGWHDLQNTTPDEFVKHVEQFMASAS